MCLRIAPFLLEFCACRVPVSYSFFADVLNDASTFVEILAPGAPENFFTPLVCAASVGKSIVGVAGGASRAALTQHQARRNNMADVAAKDGSQETLVNFVALLLNLVLIPWVAGRDTLMWTTYLVFTFVHIFANYRGVLAVRLETFNKTRLHIFAQRWLRTGRALSVAEVNIAEPVVFSPLRRLQPKLGCCFAQVVAQLHKERLPGDAAAHLLQTCRGHGYLALPDVIRGHLWLPLQGSSTAEDHLEAALVAELAEVALDLSSCSPNDILNAGSPLDTQTAHALSQAATAASSRAPEAAIQFAAGLLPVAAMLRRQFFKVATEVGWKFFPLQLNVDEWRCDWTFRAAHICTQ